MAEIFLLLFNSLPHSHDFQGPCISGLLKTLWEKEEMLVTSIFFLFPTVFSTLPKTNFYFLVTFTLSSVNAFNSNQSKILSFGKELRTFSFGCNLVHHWNRNPSVSPARCIQLINFHLVFFLLRI